MKRIFLNLICLLMAVSVFAQAPQKMSYQAVVRDDAGALVTDQSVGVRISILHGSVNGAAVYTETHSSSTNANGLMSIEIGTGSVSLGSFGAINWANGPYFIQSETDPSGGTNYTISGTSQMMSVPYAMYAERAGNVDSLIAKVTKLDAQLNGAIHKPTISYTAENNVVTFNLTSANEVAYKPLTHPGTLVMNVFGGQGGYIMQDQINPIFESYSRLNDPNYVSRMVIEISKDSEFSVVEKELPLSNTQSDQVSTELLFGQTYYVRAVITNNVGTGYSNVLTITLSDVAPVVSIADINMTYGVGYSLTLTNRSGYVVKEYGMVMSTTSGVNLQNAEFHGLVTYVYTDLSGGVQAVLQSNTEYYVRGYVVIGDDTIYSAETTFVRPLTMQELFDADSSVSYISSQYHLTLEKVKGLMYKGQMIYYLDEKNQILYTFGSIEALSEGDMKFYQTSSPVIGEHAISNEVAYANEADVVWIFEVVNVIESALEFLVQNGPVDFTTSNMYEGPLYVSYSLEAPESYTSTIIATAQVPIRRYSY